MAHSMGYTFVEGEIMVSEEVYSNFDLVDDEQEADTSEDDAVKCGDVFFVRNENFVLICGQCNAAYGDMNDFGEHMIDEHLDGREKEDPHEKNYVAIQPKTELDSFDDMEEIVAELIEIDSHHVEAQTASNQRESKLQLRDPKPSESRSEQQNQPIATVALSIPVSQFTRRQSVPHDPALYCKQCELQYPRKSLLDAHNEYKHNKPRPCEFCFKTFANTSDVIAHRATHTDERSYQCSKCPKKFTTKYYRNEHMKSIHDGIRRFKCPHCPLSFSQSCGLSVHLPHHSMPGVYSCEICNRQFAYQSEKRTHMRIHTGEKPYQCEVCGKSYGLQSRLTEHKKRHTNRKDFECKECGKRFYSNALLKYHAVGHSNYKPFQCTVCGRSFARSKGLKTHRLIHEPAKKYTCKLCYKKFAQLPGLISHMKSHGKSGGE